ncbi:MAG: 6-bladed beta-propeller [Chloroflexi bacterium]|nr:6-bladed beta-propeller [Chloroflexota bacterium]MCH8893893.1 6-bladed beta-propeller [Chloroflexota bacterium]MCI0789762.1 6-bladed beta-propeller [Chloroflexota bacterium]MCI0828830.1 6-bladed beta-propeller [Chloroflexota bacterium]MCI0847186.1 6-bladed beta-propeller [Chloroflexota bacterium]
MTTVGTGKYTYDVIENWGKLPTGDTFGMVSAIATDSKDRVFAFQRKDPPVLIFDRDGNLTDSWGNGSFEFAHGIHIADDVVYVTDRNTSVCLVYTLDGKPIQMLGRHGVHSDTGCENPGDLVPRAAGPFNYPAELVPAPSGDLYVADGYRNSRIHRFSADGQLKKSWGEPGKSGPNEFHLPHSLLIDGDHVVVCDRENHRIQVFDLDGKFIEIWDDINRPMDISMDTDGNYLVSEGQRDGGSARISILDKKGGVLSRFECRGSGHGSWIDSRGDIYLAGVPDAIDKYVRKG